jgi:hypothetical protein
VAALCSPAIENLTAPSVPHSSSKSRNTESPAIVWSGHCAHNDTSKNKSTYSIKIVYDMSTKAWLLVADNFRFGCTAVVNIARSADLAWLSKQEPAWLFLLTLTVASTKIEKLRLTNGETNGKTHLQL